MITVITPVYNGAAYIERCLESVTKQGCPQAEHLIVDGASNDGTVAIVVDYAKTHAHVRWISEQDRGQSDAMNSGIKLARGAVVGFLNVDDYYEPNVLNQVMEIFGTTPVPSLVVGNCNVWDDQGKLKKYNRPTNLRFESLLLGADVCPHPINPSAYFYHACLHDLIGPYDAAEHFCMDLDFLLRAVRSATVKHVDRTWGNYREVLGTKTMVDWQTGQGAQRAAAVLMRYRKQLPILRRIRNQVLYVTLSSTRRAKQLLRRGTGKLARGWRG